MLISQVAGDSYINSSHIREDEQALEKGAIKTKICMSQRKKHICLRMENFSWQEKDERAFSSKNIPHRGEHTGKASGVGRNFMREGWTYWYPNQGLFHLEFLFALNSPSSQALERDYTIDKGCRCQILVFYAQMVVRSSVSSTHHKWLKEWKNNIPFI